MNTVFLSNRKESEKGKSNKETSDESRNISILNNNIMDSGGVNTKDSWTNEKHDSKNISNINENGSFKDNFKEEFREEFRECFRDEFKECFREEFKECFSENFKKNSNDELNNNENENVKEHNIYKNESTNVKLRQNGQHKRLYDFSSGDNIFQHYLKKLKTCGVPVATGFTDFFKSQFMYTNAQPVPVVKPVQEENEIYNKEIKKMESEGNFSLSTSNQDGIYLFKKKIAAYNNMIANSNKIRSKPKNKSRKRKRLASKIDKKFIIKCKTCKYIHPSGFKVEDYYECQKCGDHDFSVVKAISPTDMNINMNMNNNNY